jgi:RimJ/RimL family protein N-acetyltransferase
MNMRRRETEFELTVRPATEDDVEEMVDLYVRVGSEGLFVAAEPPIDRHERRLWLGHLIDAPWTLVLVATTADTTIGYLTAVGSERQPALIGLGVAKAWRNRGVGTRLVAEAVAWARAHGLHKLAAEVFPHNEPTLHLFQKLGFEREGVLGGHYRRRNGALWDVVVFGLPLDEPTVGKPRP